MKIRTRFARYVLLQIPGWIIGAVVLGLGQYWLDLSPLVLSTVFAAWVAKDFVIYPFIKTAYDINVPTGADQLIGDIGTAKTAINPHGYIHVRGELWRARLDAGMQPIGKDERIRVHAAEGLTLTVRAYAEAPLANGSLQEKQ